jgi:hypothetical protein
MRILFYYDSSVDQSVVAFDGFVLERVELGCFHSFDFQDNPCAGIRFLGLDEDSSGDLLAGTVEFFVDLDGDVDIEQSLH